MIKKIVVGVVALGVTIFIALNGKRLIEKRRSEIKSTPTPDRERISISLVVPKRGTVKQRDKFLAFVAFDKSIEISTKMTGYIKKIYINEGDRVREGMLLAKIDDHDLKSEISLLKNTLKQQRRDYKLAKQIYNRNLKLYNIGGLPKEQLDTSKVMMDSKRSSILATELKMEQLREQKRYLNIKAPFNGIIDGIMMYEGDLALAGKPILSMSSGVKKLIFNYTPSSNIERGQKVFVDGELIGEVNLIKSVAKNGLSAAEIKLSNSLDIPIGVNIDIEVLTREANGCIVPSDTLLHKRDGVYVMLYRDGKFIPQRVEPTLEQGDKRLITPCIDGSIARGSEVTLAKLPIYGDIEIKEVN
ncbi:MAG: efflux RND transporter periplasmic adaptor subunit [Epsilonproteobacteria bacterium]|nr:efflux RND transporter periplasmic adaptor subunit [Campylobacterota bacterium]